MQELLRETDPIRLGFLAALLRQAGIEPVMLDEATSRTLGGLAAVPVRLVVAEEDVGRALALLRDAGELER